MLLLNMEQTLGGRLLVECNIQRERGMEGKCLLVECGQELSSQLRHRNVLQMAPVIAATSRSVDLMVLST